VIWPHFWPTWLLPYLGEITILLVELRVFFLSHMLQGAGIFTYIWVIIRANVGKYTSTMEHMGIVSRSRGIKLPLQSSSFFAARTARCLETQGWKLKKHCQGSGHAMGIYHV
jgi:hypothetical protein